jgi:hypothetical protein
LAYELTGGTSTQKKLLEMEMPEGKNMVEGINDMGEA